MNHDTIFSKIITHKIPADIVYQDKYITAFKDIMPKAPVHILIVPNIIIPTVNDVKMCHEPILGKLFTVAAKIAKQHGIHENGYRLIINCNHHAGQEIFHFHMHLLGGKYLGPLIE
ncbi:HIT domain-containing protein [Blochmannia endosymbiont of Camponotus (Colobopsis) obliquus]|uniref:HIT domain-containing protein n=1 Tax=Blochmannia endosymbiont of Camponotus (Colobopsis) obliquus TaxID=1505597 RepID=UPI00061A64B7|nr:HIT domain-containing protein [Blochmannia endosymbiont of Camponotus (Colobopsis) obliquus]AKC60557.1 HIT-like protein HinT [Blochmannia endosymbiont of Camponotus (Colobopsis) obliquus]